jgi:hypothetical protein
MVAMREVSVSMVSKVSVVAVSVRTKLHIFAIVSILLLSMRNLTKEWSLTKGKRGVAKGGAVMQSALAAYILHDQLFDKPVNTTEVEPLWNTSAHLPGWMKEYFDWHLSQVKLLNETNWKDQRFLVMRCLDTDNVCGGASDRLQSIPAIILMANQTRRLFFIKWSRPAPLQEFLVPPDGGLDWRVPDWLDQRLHYANSALVKGDSAQALRQVARPIQLVTVRHQTSGHGDAYYNSMLSGNELGFRQVFGEVWRTLFVPAKPVAAQIEELMNKLRLVPGRYVAAHLRSRYIRDESSNEVIENSVNCASELGPGQPVYFASDSLNATKYAVGYGQRVNGTVVARLGGSEPLHLDRGAEFLKRSDGWRGLPASAFYNVFVDLYLLSNAACIAHGVGGYGRWASMLSYNSSCARRHSKTTCGWAPAVKPVEMP